MKLCRGRNGVRVVLGVTAMVVAVAFLTGGASAAPTQLAGCQVIDQPGTYVLSGDVADAGFGTCIDIRSSDVVLDGDGYTLNNTGSDSRNVIQVTGQYDGGTNVTVRNVTLTNWNKAFVLQSDPEVTISNVYVDGAHTGVDATGTVEVTSSSFVNLTSIGISASQDTETAIRDVAIVSEGDGMLLAGPSLVEDSNVTAGSLDTGIALNDVSAYQSTFDATVRNTTVRAGWRGIRVSDGVNATLVGNTITSDDEGDVGVEVDYSNGSAEGPVHAVLDDNVVTNFTIGVSLAADGRTETRADVTVVGNEIRNVTIGVQVNRGRYGTDSLYDSEWSPDVRLAYDIRDNVIRATEPGDSDESPGLLIQDTNQGIRIEGTNGTIVDNDVHSTWDAITFHEAEATLERNLVRTDRRYGVGVHKGSTITLVGGSVRAEPPVYVTDSSLVATGVEIDANDSVYAGVTAINATVTVNGGTISNADEGFHVGDGQVGEEPSVVTAEGVAVTNVTQNFVFEGSTLTVRNSTFEGESAEEFFNATSATLTLENVSIEPGDGKQITTAVKGELGSNVTISESTIRDVETAIELDGSNGTVVGSTIENATNGIYAVDSEFGVNGSTLRDIERGIEVWQGNATVTNNTVHAERYSAIFFSSTADVRDNSFEADTAGVHFTNSEGTIENNVIVNRLSTGVNLYSRSYATIRGNDIDAVSGVSLGSGTVIDRTTVRMNDLSSSGRYAINNQNTTATDSLDAVGNYFGPDGPADDEVNGEVTFEPFLTAPSDELDGVAYADIQAFAYALDFEPGQMYAFGTPATLERNLSETFGDFEGAIYLYDESSGSWELATGDETLAAMDAVVVVPTTDARAVVDFADATPSYPTSREVTPGWNFVAPRHYDSPESAFSTRTVPLTDLLNIYHQPEDQPSTPGSDFGHHTFSTSLNGDFVYGPRVSPFSGYFVYATDSGTIPGVVPEGVTAAKVEQLLDGSKGIQ